jgi:hypothetical protein
VLLRALEAKEDYGLIGDLQSGALVSRAILEVQHDLRRRAPALSIKYDTTKLATRLLVMSASTLSGHECPSSR